LESLVNLLLRDSALFQALGYGLTAALVMFVCGFIVVNFFGLMAGAYIFLERKVAGWTNSRRGPTRVGPYGLIQFVADGVKLLLKEDVIPDGADRPFFRFAPYPVLLGTVLSFVVVPFGPKLIIGDLNLGLFYLMATGSFTVIGLIMAGWASRNKWSLLGGMRSAAQIVSYEIPNALAFLLVVLTAGTMSVQGIIGAQAGGIGRWFIFSSPFAFVAFFIYFISAVAEINRIPFDIPEAESELVSGYNVEYSAMRFAMFFAAEFGNIYVVSAAAVACFLGGWQVPLTGGPDDLAGLGRVVGQFLARPVLLAVLLVGALACFFLTWRSGRGFALDLRRKLPQFTNRLVRVNSELGLLALLFGGTGLILALHWPLRPYLAGIYAFLFVYLVPFLVFFIKAMAVSFVILWWRWTLPRLRVDQLMGVAWKYLIPIGFFCLLGQAVWLIIFHSPGTAG